MKIRSSRGGPKCVTYCGVLTISRIDYRVILGKHTLMLLNQDGGNILDDGEIMGLVKFFNTTRELEFLGSNKVLVTSEAYSMEAKEANSVMGMEFTFNWMIETVSNNRKFVRVIDEGTIKSLDVYSDELNLVIAKRSYLGSFAQRSFEDGGSIRMSIGDFEDWVWNSSFLKESGLEHLERLALCTMTAGNFNTFVSSFKMNSYIRFIFSTSPTYESVISHIRGVAEFVMFSSYSETISIGGIVLNQGLESESVLHYNWGADECYQKVSKSSNLKGFHHKKTGSFRVFDETKNCIPKLLAVFILGIEGVTKDTGSSIPSTKNYDVTLRGAISESADVLSIAPQNVIFTVTCYEYIFKRCFHCYDFSVLDNSEYRTYLKDNEYDDKKFSIKTSLEFLCHRYSDLIKRLEKVLNRLVPGNFSFSNKECKKVGKLRNKFAHEIVSSVSVDDKKLIRVVNYLIYILIFRMSGLEDEDYIYHEIKGIFYPELQVVEKIKQHEYLD